MEKSQIIVVNTGESLSGNSNEDEKLNDNNGVEEDLEKVSKMEIVEFNDAPKFMQDNEYIVKGYLLNCTNIKKAFQSLLMWHNETINIWSHLLGAFFFFLLIFYTSIFVTNFRTQLKYIKQELSSIKSNSEYLYNVSPNLTSNLHNSILKIQYIFEEFTESNIYEESLRKTNKVIEDMKSIISNAYNHLSNYFWAYLSHVKEGIYSIKEHILDLLKLDRNKSDDLETKLEKKYDLELKNREPKELERWPLFIIIHAAILCFIFSATFHCVGTINERYHDILNRFDYGGISLLISGSCFPPYFYFFYYSKGLKCFYLTEITVLGVGTFLYSLTDDFNKPKRRTFRGILFLIFGLCTGIPILHISFFGDKIEGLVPGLQLIHWYLGGISYVVGALLYILRFPEKTFKGKFDYIGASHQIFHVLVFCGAFFHFLGSLDAYNYRFKNFNIQ